MVHVVYESLQERIKAVTSKKVSRHYLTEIISRLKKFRRENDDFGKMGGFFFCLASNFGKA